MLKRFFQPSKWYAAQLLLLAASIVVTAAVPAAAAPDPAQIPVPTQTVPSEQALVHSADLIVEGRLEDGQNAYPTGGQISGRKIVHYLQTIRVNKVWKGSAAAQAELLTSGVEPLPDAADPLNKTFTGPLESGEYVFFLKRTGESGYYTLAGLWQGLVPIHEGKSISLLANGGFAAFDQLTLQQLHAKIQSLAAP